MQRYSRRGVPNDDLRQIALLATIHAVERFDPDRGVQFSTFASRTVEGELKRHFRDRTWSVRPPRRDQELHLAVRRAEEDLTHQLGRSPTAREIATTLGVHEDRVLGAIEAGVAHQAASLDEQLTGTDDRGPRRDGATIAIEVGYAQVDLQMVVRDLMAGLPERERRILHLRFFEGLTQPEIAAAMGCSQSYLSRLLRRTLVQLRARLREP